MPSKKTDFPMKHGDFPSFFCACLTEGKSINISVLSTMKQYQSLYWTFIIIKHFKALLVRDSTMASSSSRDASSCCRCRSSDCWRSLGETVRVRGWNDGKNNHRSVANSCTAMSLHIFYIYVVYIYIYVHTYKHLVIKI